jgi:predicted  nucleic acid-binding Zn-ribbon protein
MSAALGLLRLQQVDIRMSRNEARLQQIQEMLDNNAELVAARKTLAGAQSRLFDAEHARRLAEADAEGQQAKIAQTESTLFGGSVRNPKELQDLQADVASLKRRLAATEDQELQAMLNVEAVTAEVQAAQERLNRVQSALENEHRKLIEERSGLLGDRDNLLAERQAALGPVAGAAVGQYEALRRQRRGVAVAEVIENTCNACGTTLTAALQQSARHADQLVYCPSCGRILYAG